jgi:hypothetical protein
MHLHPDLTIAFVETRRADFEAAADIARLRRQARAVAQREQRDLATVTRLRQRRFRLLQLATHRPEPAPAA